MNILVVEDSKMLRETLRDGLAKLGYGVDAVGDGLEGLDYARFKEYDVIVLDLMLPGLDGLGILRQLRAAGKKTHVLILSAKDQVADRVRGLQIGADDYMIKPFSFDELCARIQTLIRRRYDAKNPLIKIGGLTLNTALREVRQGKCAIPLTPGEYAILEFLVLNRGRTVTTEQLLNASRDSDATPSENVVQVMVCNLRRKLADAKQTDIVQTRRGYGYYVD
ncbi:MAG: response regulator transcription factor [Kiritimatiellae bacterium]|nr:response regulator transcription factor [Kiritimatiellia bacterium]